MKQKRDNATTRAVGAISIIIIAALLLVAVHNVFARVDCAPGCDAPVAPQRIAWPTKTATPTATQELAPGAVGPTTWESLPPTAAPPTAAPPTEPLPVEYPPPATATPEEGYPSWPHPNPSATYSPTRTPPPDYTPGPTLTPPLPEG